jgi:Ca-activated chloride channel family protein
VLEENADYLKRSRDVFTSGVAPAPTASASALGELEKQSREAANKLDGDEWDRTRKTMRYDQHKSKVQQAY